MNRYSPPLFDGAGIGGRLAVTQGAAWRSPDTAGMEAMLGTATGNAASLAESPDWLDLLTTMLSQRAVSVFISGATVGRNDPGDAFAKALFPAFETWISGLTEADTEKFKEIVTAGTYPPAFDTYSVATMYDAKGFHTLVGYAYASQDEALASVPQVIAHFEYDHLPIPFDSMTYADEFGDATVYVQGRIVLVKLDHNVTVDIVDGSATGAAAFAMHE